MGYFFLRYGIASLAFLGWLFYQVEFKKKEWKDMKSDATIILIFVLVWVGIFWWANA
jgi:hypothetical protein